MFFVYMGGLTGGAARFLPLTLLRARKLVGFVKNPEIGGIGREACRALLENVYKKMGEAIAMHLPRNSEDGQKHLYCYQNTSIRRIFYGHFHLFYYYFINILIRRGDN